MVPERSLTESSQGIQRHIQLQNRYDGFPEDTERSVLDVGVDKRTNPLFIEAPGFCDTGNLVKGSSRADMRRGSRPLPEAVTRSTGIGRRLSGSVLRKAATRNFMALRRSGLGRDEAFGFPCRWLVSAFRLFPRSRRFLADSETPCSGAG